MDPPFIKLRPTQSHGSSATVSSEGVDSQGSNANVSCTVANELFVADVTFLKPQSTAASSPPASPRLELGTHNTIRARYHVKDIGEFAQALEFVRQLSL
jgi:hypothetical protein